MPQGRKRVEIYTASNTWTRRGENIVDATAQGAGGGSGGGGGSATSQSGDGGGASGGGSGEHKRARLIVVAILTLTITIGAAGAAGAGGVGAGAATDGGDGGATSIGTLIALGGLKGKLGSPGTGGGNGAGAAASGRNQATGVFKISLVNASDLIGTDGSCISLTGGVGAAKSGTPTAGESVPGYYAGGAVGLSVNSGGGGGGAASKYGAGTAGADHITSEPSNGVNATTPSSTAYGAAPGGGSGAANDGTASNFTGGNGAVGIAGCAIMESIG